MNPLAFLLILAAVVVALMFWPPARAFALRWREYWWLAAAAALAYLAWKTIPVFDPRAGMDGWGDLFNAMVAAIKGFAGVAAAYLCKKHLSTDLDDDQERQLAAQLKQTPEPVPDEPIEIAIERARGIRHGAFIILAADRLGWPLWLGFWYMVLF